MTVSATTRRNDDIGNGATATYDFTFRIFAATDLLVTKKDTAGVETTLAYPTDYSVTGVGLYSGGSITLTAGVLTTDHKITIRRKLPLTQLADIRNQGGYYPDVVENALDRLDMIALQHQDEIDRSVKLPETESGALVLPTLENRLSKFLAFDAAGNPIAATVVSSTPVSSFMATVLDDTTAAAARATLGAVGLTGDEPIAGNKTFTGTPKFAASNLLAAGLLLNICDGRLTLTTATPVTTSDVTAATTIYWTPYKGNRVALYDGTDWNLLTFSELSLAVPATTATIYDVFAYNNAGTVAIETTAWTNDTTRATALALQNGVLVRSGATTRRYIGTFRTTAVSGQTQDAVLGRYVWNYYNRVWRNLRSLEGTDSWAYTLATIRQANASTANQLDFVIGWSEDHVSASVFVDASNTNASVGMYPLIGLDSTTAAASGCIMHPGVTPAAGARVNAMASWKGYPGVGRHYIAWLEYSDAVGTTTWFGDNGAPTRYQNGIHGEMWG